MLHYTRKGNGNGRWLVGFELRLWSSVERRLGSPLMHRSLATLTPAHLVDFRLVGMPHGGQL